MASAVGKPLYADSVTEQCKRLNYATSCVEIDVNSELPESFDVVLANGACFTIKVWYPWRPLKCSKCRVFGHRTCQDVATGGTNVVSGQIGNKAKVWVVKDNGHGPSTVADRKDNDDSILCLVPSPKLLTPVSTPCAIMSPSGWRGGIVEEVCNDVLVDSLVEFVVASSSTNVHNPVQCSLNKFSVLEAAVVVEGDDSFLPSEVEFVAGLSQVDIPPIALPKGRIEEEVRVMALVKVLRFLCRVVGTRVRVVVRRNLLLND